VDHPAWDGAGFSGGTVTQIAFQQRAESQRVNIFLDGQYAFSLSAVIGLPLHNGAVLERPQIAELLARDAEERAYDRALIFLAARPRSESEVRQRLREADFPATVIDRVVERLLAQGLVNDEEFAQYWVGQRSTFRPRGTRALQAELRRKGVDSSTVEAALEPVEATQVEAACRAAQRKASRLAALDERAFGQALTPFLVRRGFDYPTIRTAVRVLWAGRDASPEGRDEDDVSFTG
jgi:regulatory protein